MSDSDEPCPVRWNTYGLLDGDGCGCYLWKGHRGRHRCIEHGAAPRIGDEIGIAVNDAHIRLRFITSDRVGNELHLGTAVSDAYSRADDGTEFGSETLIADAFGSRWVPSDEAANG